MRTIRNTLQKEGYQQYWFLNNLVELHREIEAVQLSRLEHRANNARVESSSLYGHFLQCCRQNAYS